jgi:hypothetical protein
MQYLSGSAATKKWIKNVLGTLHPLKPVNNSVPVSKIDSLYPEIDIERSPLFLFVTNSKQEF